MPKKRHRWSSTPLAGQSADCLDCGTTIYHQHNKIKVFTKPGSTLKVNQRPPCIPLTKP